METSLSLIITLGVIISLGALNALYSINTHETLRKIIEDDKKVTDYVTNLTNIDFVGVEYLLKLGIVHKEVDEDLIYVTCGDDSTWIGSKTYNVFMRIDINKFH